MEVLDSLPGGREGRGGEGEGWELEKEGQGTYMSYQAS